MGHPRFREAKGAGCEQVENEGGEGEGEGEGKGGEGEKADGTEGVKGPRSKRAGDIRRV